jgi:hypothetical protein
MVNIYHQIGEEYDNEHKGEGLLVMLLCQLLLLLVLELSLLQLLDGISFSLERNALNELMLCELIGSACVFHCFDYTNIKIYININNLNTKLIKR